MSKQKRYWHDEVKDCKSCIILATCSDTATRDKKAQRDAKVIKSILAVRSVMEGIPDFNIVAEIYDRRFKNVAENTIQVLGGCGRKV